MPQVVTATEVSLTNRPDVIRDLYRERLSKTQLNKGTFYKFLLQAEIPYTPVSYINIQTRVNVDRFLGKSVGKKTTATVKTYDNLNKVSIVCKLDGVYVDSEPVYVEIRYKNYEEMSNGERNRLLAIQNSLNIVTLRN